jgi:hypothetical protein
MSSASRSGSTRPLTIVTTCSDMAPLRSLHRLGVNAMHRLWRSPPI